MFHQSTNGRRKVKCFKVDHALKLALLLVVGVWFLYQIGQSGEMIADHGENIKNKTIEDGVAGFGRKVKLNVRNMIETDMGNENFEDEGELMEDGGVGDKLDRNSEEKTEEEVLDKELDDLGDNVENQEGEMDGKEEGQQVADDEDDGYSDSTENFILYRTETADGEASLDLEIVPQSDNRSDYADNVAPSSDKFSKSSLIDRYNGTEKQPVDTYIGSETVETQQGNNVSESDATGDSTIERLNAEANHDVEMDVMLETENEDSIASDSSLSMVFDQSKDELLDLNTLPETENEDLNTEEFPVFVRRKCHVHCLLSWFSEKTILV